VVITGAGGFIGRHLVQHQLDRGRRVRALDRNAEGLRGIEAREGVECIVGDVADVALQRKAVEGAHLVFHLASAHLETELSDAEYHRINVGAVETLLRECQRAGVRRVVHVSSCGVHGNVPHPPASEESPFHPDIPYERTKLAGERLARDFHRRTGLSVVVARPVWVYGPGCRRTARLFRAIASRRFVMIGTGRNYRSAVYISDALDALELCATRQDVDGQAFIVTHDELVTVGQIMDEIARLVRVRRPPWQLPLRLAMGAASLIERVARAAGRQPPLSRRSLKFFTNDAAFTCAKARRMLGFEPRFPLHRGLELTHRWWRDIHQG
jgi:nucleoside-diphosphate-sugar epimerase